MGARGWEVECGGGGGGDEEYELKALRNWVHLKAAANDKYYLVIEK